MRTNESVAGLSRHVGKMMLTLRPAASGHFFSAGNGKLIVHVDLVLLLGEKKYIPHCGTGGKGCFCGEGSKHFAPLKARHHILIDKLRLRHSLHVKRAPTTGRKGGPTGDI